MPQPFYRSLTIAPLALWGGTQYGETVLGYTPIVRVTTVFKLTDDELGRVTATTAAVEFRK
jgi:hypothetical protein